MCDELHSEVAIHLAAYPSIEPEDTTDNKENSRPATPTSPIIDDQTLDEAESSKGKIQKKIANSAGERIHKNMIFSQIQRKHFYKNPLNSDLMI
jgi:hypothetical protein